MKSIFAVLAVLSAQLVVAHYTLPDLIANGTTAADWVYVRETENHYSNGPVTDVTSAEFRCYELDMSATPGETSIATVQAGSAIGFKASDQFTFTIPKNLPSGQYLVRGEQIALHLAETFGGAQFYIGCAQVNVVNGGSGTPGPLVSIPGVYTGNEPGILLNIYSLPANYPGYISPGPAVWSG
uniref:lytic cellulose monooxygenase (C4-dehydrogenating) n=1 Tax=Ganoderma boninense TaxID=34458 RepID=A0A5K1K506_9APHY|nr:Uncharacterized protein [Ganoderma boninense]